MKHLFLILSIFFAFHSQSLSQDLDRLQGFKIGVTPTALLNRWLGIQGAVSYTYKRFELEANVGRLFGTDQGDPYTGIRIRPVLKYYFADNGDQSYYVGFGGLHRSVDIDATGTFGRFDDSYFQELDFNIKYNINGAYLMIGFLMPLRSDRFFVDFGTGIGSAKMKVEHFGVPEDANYYYDGGIFSFNTKSVRETGYLIFFSHIAFLFKF